MRSFERASIVAQRVLHVRISDTTVGRIVRQLGTELSKVHQTSQRSDGKEAVVPELAAVSCDGGRIRTREPGQGRGVTLPNESGWRETKNALFERMTPDTHHEAGIDPCPELPDPFHCAKKVASIAEKPAPNVLPPSSEGPSEQVRYEGPTRLLRTAISSMSCSDDFGVMMKREASRRRFFDARTRAFLGDGLNWNWSIWKRHFPTFVPILDFIHAIQYLYRAAMAHSDDDEPGWKTYQRYARLCWQGEIEAVIEDLQRRCAEEDIDWQATRSDDDHWKPVTDAIRYFRNNKERMDYPRYRAAGLPVTSAPMESLIKQINTRVKGTEMFWDAPAGAEAILQVRAASLCEDDRLDQYLATRPGYPFVRRSTTATLIA